MVSAIIQCFDASSINAARSSALMPFSKLRRAALLLVVWLIGIPIEYLLNFLCYGKDS